ncbi:hypothetical protein [Nostoc sp.]|uniref:hypothetical protein n=1 Tax=Nostoc sp. TaxID=1180 RepID=UPI002FF72E92
MLHKLRYGSVADTNSIYDCNTFLGKDAMNRVSTNGLFVAFFFPIGMRQYNCDPAGSRERANMC